jgi:30S ribosomal protein 3
VLLNRLTEVINYWQEQETKHTLDEAKAAFADCSFIGA